MTRSTNKNSVDQVVVSGQRRVETSTGEGGSRVESKNFVTGRVDLGYRGIGLGKGSVWGW